MTAPERPRPLRHVPELDAVRGLAFLLVFFAHLWPGAVGYDGLNRLIRYGWAGVDLFFVLSGFLITSILWHDRAAPFYYRNFYGRRVLRIVPAFLLLLGLVWALDHWRQGLMAPLGQQVSLPAVLPYHALLYLFMLANVAGVLYGGAYGPVSITWSLAVEEHFYLVWPLLVRRLQLRTLLVLSLAIVVGSPLLRYVAGRAGVSEEGLYILTPFRLDGLALGALIALALANDLVSRARLRQMAVWILTICGPVFLWAAAAGAILPASESLRSPAIVYTLLGVLMACVVILGLVPGPITKRLFAIGPLQYLGKVSYGAYLFHWLVAVVVNALLRRVGYPLPVWNDASLGACVLYVLIVGTVTFRVAALSWRFYERPILSLKRYFDAWGPRPGTPPVTAGEAGTAGNGARPAAARLTTEPPPAALI